MQITDPSVAQELPELQAPVVVDVEIRRSARRRKTVSARLVGQTLIVQLPAGLSAAEEAGWVERMRKRLEVKSRRRSLNSQGYLKERARVLNHRYFDGALQWQSIEYVTNQRSRYGSCTPASGTIRLSDCLAAMPGWVRDYVIVHELAHLLVPGHGSAFWNLVNRYPLTERARGYLIATGMDQAN